MNIEVRDPASASEFIVPADLPQDGSDAKITQQMVELDDEPATESAPVENSGDSDEPEMTEEESKAAKAAAKEAYRRRRAEREQQTAQERIRALEEQIKEMANSRSQMAQNAVAEAPKRPDPKSYDLGRWDPKYEQDLTAWMDAREAHILQQATMKAQETTSSLSREAQMVQEQAQLTSMADQVEQRGLDKYADFTDIVEDALTAMPPHPEAVKRLVQLPNAEDVFYHLAQKPDELERITGLDPMDQTLEFGKISARLAARSKAAVSIPKAKPTPKAPRGDSGQFESEADARYAKMLKATRTW